VCSVLGVHKWPSFKCPLTDLDQMSFFGGHNEMLGREVRESAQRRRRSDIRGSCEVSDELARFRRAPSSSPGVWLVRSLCIARTVLPTLLSKSDSGDAFEQVRGFN